MNEKFYRKNFEDHTIKEVGECENLFEWSKDGTSFYKVFIHFRPNYILMYGDLNPLVFAPYVKNTLLWALNSDSIGYVCEKLKNENAAYDPVGTKKNVVREKMSQYVDLMDDINQKNIHKDHPFMRWYHEKLLKYNDDFEDFSNLETIFSNLDMPTDPDLISFTWEMNSTAMWGFYAVRTFCEAYKKKYPQMDPNKLTCPHCGSEKLCNGRAEELPNDEGFKVVSAQCRKCLREVPLPEPTVMKFDDLGDGTVCTRYGECDQDGKPGEKCKDCLFSFPIKDPEHKGLYVVRLYDGMDGAWVDLNLPVPYVEAKRIYNAKTNNGTSKISHDEIDYYEIFKADSKMVYDHENPMLR